jgi:6-phosphogluconolactonase
MSIKKFLQFSIYTVILLIITTQVAISQENKPGKDKPGTVFTASNDPAGNNVIVFNRAADGTLTLANSFATGGLGTGAALGNAHGLVLSSNGKKLLVVNAGSDDVSVFKVHQDELKLKGQVPSGGQHPISIAIRKDVVYILNAGGQVGGTDNISGFTLTKKSGLTPIPNSILPLSAASTNPAQISFSNDGKSLIVTEKDTNIIDTYSVDDDGLATGPTSQPSAGIEPFGFEVNKRNQVFVSEAFQAAPDASAVSSYSLDNAGTLTTIDASEPTTETAACWVVLSKDEKFLYDTNTGSGTITGFSIDSTGNLTLLDPTGVSATTGPMPIDIALSNNGLFLYNLNSGDGSISGFRVASDGTLTAVGAPVTGLPLSANGLAAR